MFSKVGSKEEELKLLKFAMDTAKANKELIAALEEFEVETKSNGEIHKGKEKRRIALIKSLKKENKELKKFFTDRNKPQEYDHNRYQYKEEISERRNHLQINRV